MKFDQDLCLNLWYDFKKLLWQDELNPRVRCAFGNVCIKSSLEEHVSSLCQRGCLDLRWGTNSLLWRLINLCQRCSRWGSGHYIYQCHCRVNLQYVPMIPLRPGVAWEGWENHDGLETPSQFNRRLEPNVGDNRDWFWCDKILMWIQSNIWCQRGQSLILRTFWC